VNKTLKEDLSIYTKSEIISLLQKAIDEIRRLEKDSKILRAEIKELREEICTMVYI